MERQLARMKILVISNMYPRFLGGNFVHEQIRHLMDRGCEAKVIVPVPYCPGILGGIERWKVYANIPHDADIDNVPVRYPRYLRLRGRRFHALSCYAQYAGIRNAARSIIQEFKPDLIHAHAATAAGYLGLLLKDKYNIPLVCSMRGSDINLYPRYGKNSMRLTKKVLAGADRIVSVSNALKTAANTIAKPKKEIRVVYNGCDVNAFVRNNADRIRPMNPGPFFL